VCTWARAGVGAIATQSFTDLSYAVRGLELLADGVAPDDALRELLAADDRPERVAGDADGVSRFGRAARKSPARRSTPARRPVATFAAASRAAPSSSRTSALTTRRGQGASSTSASMTARSRCASFGALFGFGLLPKGVTSRLA
jgi:hypothetical protein